jgi:uncharacterized protein (TIGR03083 family)
VTDVGAAYAAGRQRLTELVQDLDEDAAAMPVPCCPAWSVTDVVAHLTGVCADVLAGRIDGVGTDPWTDAQVVARRDLPLKDVVAEWNDVAPAVEAMAGAFGAAGFQWVGDQAIHEHDVRGALDRPGARDSETIEVGLRLALPPFDAMRSLCGRRSVDQLRALPWTADPEPYLEAFTWGPFTPPAADVVE